MARKILAPSAHDWYFFVPLLSMTGLTLVIWRLLHHRDTVASVRREFPLQALDRVDRNDQPRNTTRKPLDGAKNRISG